MGKKLKRRKKIESEGEGRRERKGRQGKRGCHGESKRERSGGGGKEREKVKEKE